MGRTSFPQNTSSIRTMDFSRDFGARRGKSCHRIGFPLAGRTTPWGYIKILQGSVARRESRRFTHVRTQKIRLHFRGSGTLGLSKLSDILAGPLHIFNPNNALSLPNNTVQRQCILKKTNTPSADSPRI